MHCSRNEAYRCVARRTLRWKITHRRRSNRSRSHAPSGSRRFAASDTCQCMCFTRAPTPPIGRLCINCRMRELCAVGGVCGVCVCHKKAETIARGVASPPATCLCMHSRTCVHAHTRARTHAHVHARTPTYACPHIGRYIVYKLSHERGLLSVCSSMVRRALSRGVWRPELRRTEVIEVRAKWTRTMGRISCF